MPLTAKFAPARLAIRCKPIRLCCVAIELIAWKILLALRTPFIHGIIIYHFVTFGERTAKRTGRGRKERLKDEIHFSGVIRVVAMYLISWQNKVGSMRRLIYIYV